MKQPITSKGKVPRYRIIDFNTDNHINLMSALVFSNQIRIFDFINT